MQRLTTTEVALLSRLQQSRILASTDLSTTDVEAAEYLSRVGLIRCGAHTILQHGGPPIQATVYRHDPAHAQQTAPQALLRAVEAALPGFLAPLPTPTQNRAQWRIIRGTGQLRVTPPDIDQARTRFAVVR